MEKLGRTFQSEWVLTDEAKWPPAENPMMPTSYGLIFHAAAESRTVFMA